MKRLLRVLLCLSAGMLLCQCSSTDKKKSKSSELSLAQRATKPDLGKRSQYEKAMTSAHNAKGGTATHLSKQLHHSKEFTGANTYAGKKEFKAGQSWFGKSKFNGLDQTYALGNKQATGTGGTFKAGDSRFGDMKAREGSSTFNGADNVFKTKSALTRSQGTAREPLIIENYNDKGGGKKSAYSEDEVKKLLNRN